MVTTKRTIGGAIIRVGIEACSDFTPVNPNIAPSIEYFLSMMEKAAFCKKLKEFDVCLKGFLEEVDNYLDDRRLDEDAQQEKEPEMSEFLKGSMKPGVLDALKKLDRG